MENLPSPESAERNQRRKLEFIPPVWPLLAIVVVVVGVVLAVRHG